MTRTDLHCAFATRFSVPPEKGHPPVVEADLRWAEAELKTKFPRSFLSFATAHGPLFTPEILRQLVATRETGKPAPEGFDVQEFLSPAGIVETHRLYVSGGMDDSLIPIAMDCGGSVFGFRREESSHRSEDLPVLFFDHDYCSIRPVADSFDAWLQAFLVLEE